MNSGTATEKAAMDLLAADTATLAAVLAPIVTLIKAPFTPGPNLDPASLTPAAFAGSTPIARGALPNLSYIDPGTGDHIVELSVPAGGWQWFTTGAGLPETVYGWMVTNSTGTVLYGSGLLDNPVTVNAAGQGITLPNMTFRLPLGTIR